MSSKKVYICSLCGLIGHNAHNSKFHPEGTIPENLHCYLCKRMLPREFFSSQNIKHKKGLRSVKRRLCNDCMHMYESQKYVRNTHQPLNWAFRIRTILGNSKLAAKKNKLEHDIDKAFLTELLIQQDYKCYYSGLPMTAESGKFKVSIDRIDSRRGYTKDNVVLACYILNMMKTDLSIPQFIELSEQIVKRKDVILLLVNIDEIFHKF